MDIIGQERGDFRRTVPLKDTINRVSEGLRKLGLKEQIDIREGAKNLWSAKVSIEGIRAFSNGKGTTRMQALASAYAEIAERISSVDIGLTLGRHRHLYGRQAYIVERGVKYKYMEGYRWMHQDSLSHNPVRVEELLGHTGLSEKELSYIKDRSRLTRHWISGYSLVSKTVKSIPILLIKWISSTNGVASGNTIEEAIVHAVCEVFERYALINFLRSENPSNYKNIALSTIKDTELVDIINYFSSNNVDVTVKDLGQSFYPVYAVITTNKNLPFNHVHYRKIKAGCAFDSDEAIKRCFTERMQGTSLKLEEAEVAIQPSGNNPDKYMSIFFKSGNPVDLSEHIKGSEIPYRRFSLNNTKDEVYECLRITTNVLDTDLVVIDHTHSVLDFPTVRVIIPGISDFTRWWDSDKLTPEILADLRPDDDAYEEKITELLSTF